MTHVITSLAVIAVLSGFASSFYFVRSNSHYANDRGGFHLFPRNGPLTALGRKYRRTAWLLWAVFVSSLMSLWVVADRAGFVDLSQILDFFFRA